MTNTSRMVVLWVSGLTGEIANRISTVRELQTQGATISTLEPLPITGQQSQAWQMLNGQNPGRTGYFDSVMPQQYSVRPTIEPTAHMLHEIITTAGRPATQVNLAVAEVPTYLSGQRVSVECLILHAAMCADMAALDRAVEAVRIWAGDGGICLILSDYRSSAVEQYVNFNDGLHSLGILKVSDQGAIRWEDSLAYHAGHGQLWINLEGREPKGIVAPYEYDQVCVALIASLPKKLRDPHTGEQVIERIYRRDELYKGDYLFRAPDLVVVLRPGYAPSPNSMSLGFDGTLSSPAPANTYTVAGMHPATVAGLAIAVGIPFVKGLTLARAPLMNIAPTILHSLQLPVPRNMDAEVITDLFTPTFMQQFPPRWEEQSSGLSIKDEEEIMIRLRSLGYLE